MANINDGVLEAEALYLSAEAIAVLEFTTDRSRPGPDSREPFYITSKDAFLWAGLAFSIAQSASERLEDIDLLVGLYWAVQRTRDVLRDSYAELPVMKGEYNDPVSRILNLEPRLTLMPVCE